MVLIGALAAPVVVFLRRGLPESPRWLAKHGRLVEADRVLSAIEKKVAAEYGRPLPPPGLEEPVSPAGRFVDLWVPGVRGRVILMSVFNIFQTVGFYGFNNWVPSLLVKQGITISTSLGYTTVIALAAPVGPLIGFFLGDRFERKWIIVGAAGTILVCGLIFGQARDSALIIAMGVALTLGANIMSFSFHAYQQELFPTGIRARAAGFVYSWSRLSVIFSSFIIAFILETLRRLRRLRFHRGGDGDRDGDDRDFRAAHDESGAGEDCALGRLGSDTRVGPTRPCVVGCRHELNVAEATASHRAVAGGRPGSSGGGRARNRGAPHRRLHDVAC